MEKGQALFPFPPQVKTANFLLKAGCQVDVRGLHGMTALNEAAFIGHSILLKTLLFHGADPGIADDAGTLPLWFAIDHLSQESVALLLAAGSPFHTRSTLNPSLGPCNPLEYAAQKQRDVFISWMLAAYGEEAANCLRKYLPNLCLLYTSPSPRDYKESRIPSSA